MFDDPARLLWLIPALPLAGSILTAVFGPGWRKERSHWFCILGAAGACLLSVLLLVKLPESGVLSATYRWMVIGDVRIYYALKADGLTAIMLLTVTFIGTVIAIYSVGYMHHDPGYPRFFAVVSLFLFAMTVLVLADNFVLLYAGWEGVGLSSYLLIGYYFNKPAAAKAARKAFLVTRLGDVGLFIGILVIWANFVDPVTGAKLWSVSFAEVFSAAAAQDHDLLFTACLLLFCGAVGKSAQFPLHVWLPDAMEGPSPVSALIHAATMVTAGVYLVARCTPLFGFAPEAQLVVAVIGGFTALLAALIAVTQTDLKRVLAYSTVSQLGYMFLALGCGLRSERLAAFAVTAAIFHLFTHAFFKALLFLAAGSVMHAMGGVIDMRRLGGLRKVLPTTHATFLCGAAALAGVPLLSGFWSKDDILAAVLAASGQRQSWQDEVYLGLFVVGLLTALLTAFYTFRAYFLTFWGEERIPEEAGHHAHESPPVMAIPLVILAIGAVFAGIIVDPFTHWFSHLLEHKWMAQVWPEALLRHEPHSMNVALMLVSSLIALGGIGLAYFLYVKQPNIAAQLETAAPQLYNLSRNRFYIDELYFAFIVAPLYGLAMFCRLFDQYVVDGLVDLIGQGPRLVGHVFRPIQNGLVQFYALLMVLGLAGFLLSVLLR